MIPDNILSALKRFYQLVDNKNISWFLSGSTSLALQGVSVSINNDIDILTSKKGSKMFDELLSEFCIKKSEYSSTDKYKSHFGIYNIDGVTIEVMGKFQHKLRNGDWSTPSQNNKTHIFDFEKMSLPLLTLEQELEEYKNMGRYDKVEKIKATLYKSKQISKYNDDTPKKIDTFKTPGNNLNFNDMSSRKKVFFEKIICFLSKELMI